MKALFATLAECLREERPVIVATVIQSAAVPEGAVADPPALGAAILFSPSIGVEGSLGNGELDRIVTRDADAVLAAGQSFTRHYGSGGETGLDDVTVFMDVFSPPPRMIIFGAVDFTRSLVKVAKVMGYRVTVCDSRRVFATTKRFPEADEVIVQWPDEYLATVADRLGPNDAICVLTHDHKFDVPAIATALDTRVGYLGAMGSRKTHAERIERLLERGVDPARMQRIMAPIGLDIGARTPEETAIAICAEIIALRANTPVNSLRDSQGPIHTTALLDTESRPGH
ncbi:MAG: XdhC family protein [Acidimicrobiales bacterium]